MTLTTFPACTPGCACHSVYLVGGNSRDLQYGSGYAYGSRSNEGIFIGYRGYEKRGIAPLFPFGFGLSYTSYKYDNLTVSVVDKRNAVIEVKVDISNVGKMAGAEIVQVYVTDVKSKEERPLKELKGFEKVWLQPGETKSVKVQLTKEDFQYYNEKEKKWVLERGDYLIKVGASAQDIKLEQKIKL